MDAADAEAYARTRGCPIAEFDRVCGNIRGFTRTADRKCVLGLNLIVTRENSSSVRAFLGMAKDLGTDHVKVSAAVVSTRPEENAEYMTPIYEQVRRQIAQGAEELTDETFTIVDKFHMPDSDRESFERQYTWCPMSRFLTVIAADQHVYTCQDKAYTTAGLLGSIRDRSFKELWFSDDLRRRFRDLNPSADCRHHCVSHAKNLMLLDYFEADQEHLDFV
jgi:MoaA/NifB/PqqE/SkfB family radical SAM enzyme